MHDGKQPAGPWLCGACGAELETAPVRLAYLSGVFDYELPRCPRCGLTLIDEELALGKMLEVELSLEDK